MMYRAILVFFEKAGAAEGRAQWNIMVDDVDFELNHFRRFLKQWESVPCEIEVARSGDDGIGCLVGSREPQSRGLRGASLQLSFARILVDERGHDHFSGGYVAIAVAKEVMKSRTN